MRTLIQPHKLKAVYAVAFIARLLQLYSLFRKSLPVHPHTTRFLEALDRARKEGHTCFPQDKLVAELCARYAANPEDVQASLEEVIARGELVRDEDNYIFTPATFQTETIIAERLKSIGRNCRQIEAATVEAFLRTYNKPLSDEQQEAVCAAAAEGVLILAGYPGTGKTTTVNAILELFRQQGLLVHCAAPTGRASQRMAEATGRSAETLHRLMHYCGAVKKYVWNFLFPVVGDVLIVDEFSMVDTWMMAQLCLACTSRTRLIIVGDPEQLASVDAGQVLKDLIESNAVAIVRLTKVFRQDESSWVARNAAAIREGRYDDIRFAKPGAEKSDSYFIEIESAEEIAKMMPLIINQSLPKRLGYDPISQIQCLVPMKKGTVGTNSLNDILRGIGDGGTSVAGSLNFRTGDKVIHTKNNRSLKVMNGEVGEVKLAVGDLLEVEFERGERVQYPTDNWNQLLYAFAITIHKSQGSQWPCVVIPIHSSMSRMLIRALVYTAMTRAEKHVVFVGQKKAFFDAIKRVPIRHTGLKRKLVEARMSER